MYGVGDIFDYICGGYFSKKKNQKQNRKRVLNLYYKYNTLLVCRYFFKRLFVYFLSIFLYTIIMFQFNLPFHCKLY